MKQATPNSLFRKRDLQSLEVIVNQLIIKYVFYTYLERRLLYRSKMFLEGCFQKHKPLFFYSKSFYL